MSFYGSTFFQLIDTFYKIGVVNAGKNNSGFAKTTPQDDYMTQATGRKGVIRFGTGNKWIQATQETDDQGDIYTFWHMAPEANGTELTALEVLAESDLPKTVNKDTLGELTPGGYVKISSLKYDPAGHIGNTNTTYYKIPISQTEQDILDLQEAVGVPAPNGPEGKATGLFLAVDEANQNIEAVTEVATTVNDQLGSFSSVFPNTGIYKSDGEEGDAYKDFYSAFGSMDAFRAAVYEESGSSKSLIDGFLKVKADLEKKISDNNNLLTVYAQAIQKLSDDIEELKEKHKSEE